MGSFRDVSPVPNRTMVQDGNLELNPSWWYNGIIPGCPTYTKWYNGTGWTHGNKPHLVVQWDYPRMDTWDKPLLLVQWDYPRMSMETLVQWDYPGMSMDSLVQWDYPGL